MSQTITFFSDTTSDFPIAYETISSCRDILLKHNIYIPTTSSDQLYMIQSHRAPAYNIFTAFGKNKIINNVWSDWYIELKNAIENGRDVLLYGYIHGQGFPLFEFLREQETFKKCIFKIVLVRGRLACEMEQFAYQRDITATTSWNLVLQYTINKTYNNFFLEKYGTIADDIRIFLDPNESCIAEKLSQTQKEALEYTGVPTSYLHLSQPSHILCLRSQTARSLLRQSRVDDNIWPPLNDTQLVNFLQKLEQEEKFDTSAYSPPDVRIQLCTRENLLFSKLESLYENFDKKSLCCPQGLLPDVQWRSFNGVSDNELEVFAKKLPTSLAYVLKRRFLIDPELMTSTQKKLKKILDIYKPQAKKTFVSQKPTLSVLTMTYNHENYIEKCIESVQSQKTDFPIQHIIIDDCSTDSTPDIIKKYASKYQTIRPVLLGNKSSNGRNISGLFGRCRTDFAALCDGDDFFTHNDKLQRQVDFLQNHKECALCFHFVDVIYEEGYPPRVYPPIQDMPGGLRLFYPITALLKFNCIQTNSVVYRWRFRDGLPSWFDPTVCPGDWYWHLLHAETGLLGFIPKHMSVYRRHKKAIYIETEKGNIVQHRAKFGLPELKTYNVLNTHFNGKYFYFFFNLANAVFTNFAQLYINSGDSKLLEEAIKQYPIFADKFFETIKSEAAALVPMLEKFFK